MAAAAPGDAMDIEPGTSTTTTTTTPGPTTAETYTEEDHARVVRQLMENLNCTRDVAEQTLARMRADLPNPGARIHNVSRFRPRFDLVFELALAALLPAPPAPGGASQSVRHPELRAAFHRAFAVPPPVLALPASTHVVSIDPRPRLSPEDRARMRQAAYTDAEIRAFEADFVLLAVERAVKAQSPCLPRIQQLAERAQEAGARGDMDAVAALDQALQQLTLKEAPPPPTLEEYGHVPAELMRLALPVAMDEDGPIAAVAIRLPMDNHVAHQNMLVPLALDRLCAALAHAGAAEGPLIEWAFHWPNDSGGGIQIYMRRTTPGRLRARPEAVTPEGGWFLQTMVRPNAEEDAAAMKRKLKAMARMYPQGAPAHREAAEKTLMDVEMGQ